MVFINLLKVVISCTSVIISKFFFNVLESDWQDRIFKRSKSVLDVFSVNKNDPTNVGNMVGNSDGAECVTRLRPWQ